MNRIFAARFQPFHNGHLAVLEKILDIYQSDIIIGVVLFNLNDISSNPVFNRVHPINNPFTYWEIYQMIHGVIIEKKFKTDFNISILPIPAVQNWWYLTKRFLPQERIWITPEGEYKIDDKRFFDLLGEKFDIFQPPLRKVSGKLVRYRLAFKRDWESLVPISTKIILNQINAEKRMSHLFSQYNIGCFDEATLSCG